MKGSSEMSKTITATLKGTSVEVGFSAEARQAIADFTEAANAEKEAKAKKAQAEEVLRKAIGLAEFATIGGVAVYKIEHRNRTDIKRDVLKTAFPEAWEKASYENPYDFVAIVK
jgi:hypothetical protein